MEAFRKDRDNVEDSPEIALQMHRRGLCPFRACRCNGNQMAGKIAAVDA